VVVSRVKTRDNNAEAFAHCDLFRAGIARSGACNRTLAPDGFQATAASSGSH
jgi:hypothetical protein